MQTQRKKKSKRKGSDIFKETTTILVIMTCHHNMTDFSIAPSCHLRFYSKLICLLIHDVQWQSFVIFLIGWNFTRNYPWLLSLTASDITSAQLWGSGTCSASSALWMEPRSLKTSKYVAQCNQRSIPPAGEKNITWEGCSLHDLLVQPAEYFDILNHVSQLRLVVSQQPLDVVRVWKGNVHTMCWGVS